MRFELVTLGSVALVGPGGELVLQKSKLLAILTWILASPRKTTSRPQLADLFWGDSSPVRAGRALRTALYRIRSALGDSAPENSGPEVQLSVPVILDCDVFTAALDAGDVETAMSLYQGPFFSEYSDAGTAAFEQWVDVERARLEGLYLRAAQAQAQRYLNTGRTREALDLARRVRRAAPDAEAGWRLLLQALLAQRDQFNAQLEAEAFGKWLEQRNSAPDPASSRILELARGALVEESAEAPETFVPELVGREGEFSAIMGAWEGATRGRASHLHLSSPAGFGKTRLLDEAARRIRIHNSRVASIRAMPGERDVAFALAAELARVLSGLPGAAGIPPDSLRVLVALQPALSSRFSGITPAPAASDLLLQRSQALAELVAAVAEERPLALLVDDLHWADAESRRVFRALAARLEGQRVLLLTAARPGYGDVGERADLVSLPALTLAETELLLTTAGTFPTPACATRMAGALHRVSGGCPLLIIDALRRAFERRELTLQGGAWTSPDIEGVLARLEQEDRLEVRFASLDSIDRHLLTLLSVAGAPVSLEDLAVLSRTTPLGIRPRLIAMERRGYVALTERGWDVVNEDLVSAILAHRESEEIRSAHLAIGKLLSARAADRVVSARAIRHLMAAGARRDVLGVSRKAVAMARSSGDWSPTRDMVRALLGPASEDAVTPVVRALPWNLRFRVPVGALAVSIVAGCLLGTLLLSRILGVAVRSPEKTLVLFMTDASGNFRTITRYPLSRTGWNTDRPLTRDDASGSESWQGLEHSMDAAPSPDARRIAFARVAGDSGGIDLFLREANGSIRRLTGSFGDDSQPGWSPDGRFLVFHTTRWNPTGDFDLALLDLEGGAVRQLTEGSDSDVFPRWSPDGSRIGFIRGRATDGARLLCWVTFDGQRSRCHDGLAAQPDEMVGWLDADHLVIASSLPGGQPGPILSVDASTGAHQVIRSGLAGRASLSTDATWMAIAGSDSVWIFRTDEPQRSRAIAVVGHQLWFEGRGSATLPTLRVARPVPAFAGVPTLLSFEEDSGAVVRFPVDALSWESEDSATAVVLPGQNFLLPMSTGSTSVRLLAGGWRSTVVPVVVTEPWSRPLFSDQWTDPTFSQWEKFGDPPPLLVSTEDSGQAFFTNGDNTFETGIVTRRVFAADSGLGFEARLRMPITDRKWQFIRVKLGTVEGIRDYGGIAMQGCEFAFPIAEGNAYRSVAGLTSSERETKQSRVSLGDGTWHRVRIQIFPDGTCGYAFDGKPFFRSAKPTAPLTNLRLAICGQSVGTRILVGPVEIWQGVRTDMRWEELNRQ